MSNLQIRIKLAEKEYTLKSSQEEEPILREAGKVLNEQIRELQRQSGIWDKQDLLVMVAFDGVVRQLKKAKEGQSNLEEIDNLSVAIEQALKGD